MSHHENLKVLVFIGDNQSLVDETISYFTENGYPKVQAEGIESQIEHLAQAGQHRIVTDEIIDYEAFKLLESAFPGNVQLVALTHKKEASEKNHENNSFMSHADHHIGLAHDEPLSDQLEEVVETLDFGL